MWCLPLRYTAKIMAKATFVKSARKDNPVAKKGESYWWWAFMVGGRGGPKQYSKEKPSRSQLTSSNFLSQIYDLEDRGFAGSSPEDLQSERDEMVSELESLADECDDSLSAMPDGLQQGDTGQMLEARAEGCRSTAQEFEQVDLDYEEPTDEELIAELKEEDSDASDEEIAVRLEQRREEKLEEWCDEKRDELSNVGFEYE